MSRTRVAIVAPRYTELGGMQNYARRVAAWLRARDDEFEVVVISTKDGLRRDETVLDGVRVIRLGTWLTLSNTPVNPFWYWQLRRLFRTLGVDVVNAHSPVPVLADLALVAARRRPTVLTYHAGSLVKGTGGLVDAILRMYERIVLPRVFARAGRHIAVSPVATNLRTGRAVTITPGVDTEVFRPGGEREQSVVFTGRLDRTSQWKGVHVLVAAFAQLAAGLPGVRLDVVGDGDALPDLQRQADELGVGDRVRWHGALPATGVAEVLSHAGVAVLPSLTEAESFGMTLIEAMAAGVPVVGSDVGGIPHVVRDGVDGLLVPPGDATALAAAMRRVLVDPELATRLGAAGRQAAVDTWDWRRQEERTMAELRHGAPERGRPRIAVVTDSVSPWHTGGKEQRQHELYTRLAARGYQIDVYTMKWWRDETRSRSVVRDGVTFHALSPYVPLYTKGRRSILQAAVFAVSTLRMLTRRFDVLEVDSIPFLPVFPGRLVARLRRRPMTVTSHEYWGTQYWTTYLGALGPLGRLAGLVERTAIRLPDRIAAASDGTAERLRAEGARDVRTVTPGIGADVLDAPRAGRVSPPDVLDLVCAGRLLDHKNVDVAIRTVDVLARRGVAARLTVIGQGPAAEDLARLVKQLRLDDRVEFVPHLPEHRDVLARFATADLLLFPSVREGFGMVALEAMAVATPVITSDHPDNFARHLVRPGSNGTVCEPTPEAFADAVESCRERLAQLSAGARECAAGYDWDSIADRAEAVFADLR